MVDFSPPHVPKPPFWSRPSSLRSFGKARGSSSIADGSKSNPASLKRNRRKSFALFPSLLSNSRKNGRTSHGKDAVVTEMGVANVPSDSPATTSVESIMPQTAKSNGLETRQPKPPPIPPSRPQPASAKRTGFIRRISTTFRKPSAPKNPSTALVSDAARVQREAALRARGLLPPLNPNKDLSQLEREQDRLLAVVSPAPEMEQVSQENGLSAADRIKQEYEQKSRAADMEQLKRLKTFKFGGSSSSLILQVTSPPGTEADVPLPSPALSTRLVRSESSTPVPQLPSDPFFEVACSLPLPPSPRLASRIACPSRDALCQSPTEADRFLASTDSSATLADTVKTPLPPSPTSPTSASYRSTEDGCLAPPSRARSNTNPPSSESDESSLATPSLVSSSTSTTLNTASSSSLDSKVMKTWAHETAHNISVIVESPSEEFAATESRLPTPTPLPTPKRSQTIPSPPPAPSSSSLAARRKTGLFKKTINVPPSPSRRLSLNNLRLAVSGSLSKEAAPESSRERSASPHPVGTGTRPSRRPVAPTLHSRGSILFEAAGIEDEESRRMTEMAFLG